MKKKDYKYTCIALSMYALLQYLLLQSEKDAKENTFYFFGSAIPKSIATKLSSEYPLEVKSEGLYGLNRILRKIRVRFIKDKLYPFLKESQLYAQDHCYMHILIGKKKYFLLSDAPAYLSLNYQTNSTLFLNTKLYSKSIRGMIETFLYGKNIFKICGDNQLCTDVYLTEENTSHILEGKQIHIDSLQDMWDQSSQSKRQFINEIFDISIDDLNLCRSKRIIFFSQPFVGDRILTEREYAEILQRIFRKFPTDEILIKLHPRDDFDYTIYFPETSVFKKKVNMQVLQLNGVVFDKAVTICSTAVVALPDTTEIIWLGPSINPKIENAFGGNYILDKHKHYSTIEI